MGDTRSLRIVLGEQALGIPWMPRCGECYRKVTEGAKICNRCNGRCIGSRYKLDEKKTLFVGMAYERQIPVSRIAEWLGVTRERVYQRLRSLGMVDGKRRAPRKSKVEARRRAIANRKRKRYLQALVTADLYKLGWTVPELRKLPLPGVQHTVQKYVKQRRPPGLRATKKGHRYEKIDWSRLADGEWHYVRIWPDAATSRSHWWARRNGMKAHVRSVPNGSLVMFEKE